MPMRLSQCDPMRDSRLVPGSADGLNTGRSGMCGMGLASADGPRGVGLGSDGGGCGGDCAWAVTGGGSMPIARSIRYTRLVSLRTSCWSCWSWLGSVSNVILRLVYTELSSKIVYRS